MFLVDFLYQDDLGMGVLVYSFIVDITYYMYRIYEQQCAT